MVDRRSFKADAAGRAAKGISGAYTVAGDWIQIDCDLPEKIETQMICDRANCSADVTIGRLVLLWRWIDRHATREFVQGASVSTLSRVALGDESFWRAVESVGWLKIEPDGIRIPKWSKRFSKSSKARALKLVRNHRYRAKRGANGAHERLVSASSAHLREEKKRVEKSREEKSKEDKGEDPLKPPTAPGSRELFAEFWDAYPARNGKKLGKSTARGKFDGLSNDDQAAAVIAARNYCASEGVRRGFAKDAKRFLEADFWRDWMTPEDQQPALMGGKHGNHQPGPGQRYVEGGELGPV